MKKQTLIVNLFGGPGTGKSTTAAAVFSLLKLHHVDVELVTEFAKNLVWEERFKTMEDQAYILGKQQHRLWRLVGTVDVIVTDSPILLSIIYKPEEYKNSFINYVIDLFSGYNNLNIYLNRTKKYSINGRTQTEDEAKTVDKIIKNVLNKYQIPYEVINGDYSGINKIAELVVGSELTTRLVNNTT